MYGFAYGDATNLNSVFDYENRFGRKKANYRDRISAAYPEYKLTHPGTWDALNWYECACFGGAGDGHVPGTSLFGPRYVFLFIFD